MSDTPSAVTDPPLEGAVVGSEHQLEQLLRQQRMLAWLLSTLTLIATVAFFAMMTMASPLLSRVAFGHSVTVANVAAVAIILLFLTAIAVFGWRAKHIDALLNESETER